MQVCKQNVIILGQKCTQEGKESENAKCIKGMLTNPDMQLNAAMNKWVQRILFFDFELIYVPAESMKRPDAVSRKRPTKQEIIEA